MLDLEKQVCSLELAKRLKELGVKQEGYFAWARQDGFKEWGLELYSSNPELQRIGRTYYVAFTVAELGYNFPTHFRFTTEIFKGLTENNINSVSVGFLNKVILTETEADTRAKMLIYLIENKLVDLSKYS